MLKHFSNFVKFALNIRQIYANLSKLRKRNAFRKTDLLDAVDRDSESDVLTYSNNLSHERCTIPRAFVRNSQETLRYVKNNSDKRTIRRGKKVETAQCREVSVEMNTSCDKFAYDCDLDKMYISFKMAEDI